MENLKVVSVNPTHCELWNDWIKPWNTFGLLQSYEWGELKEKQGWKTIRLAVERESTIVAVAQMLIKPIAHGLSSMAYIPRGPLVDWEDRAAVNALLNALHAEARRHNAICLRIEPPLLHDAAHHMLLQSFGFQPIAFCNQPRCSMIVHLPDDMEKLLMALPGSTRANIRKSARLGVTIDVGGEKDLPTFFRLMEITSARDDFPIRPFGYYASEWRTFAPRGQVRLFLARYENQIVAAQMPFYFGEHAATFHAGSLNEYRNVKAGYLMMWQALCWAQQQGCRTFDLWGIPDQVGELIAQGKPIPEDQTGGLWGVYYYKRAFRGEVVYYVGAYDYVYSATAYRALDLVTSRLRSLDKMASLGDRLKSLQRQS